MTLSILSTYVWSYSHWLGQTVQLHLFRILIVAGWCLWFKRWSSNPSDVPNRQLEVLQQCYGCTCVLAQKMNGAIGKPLLTHYINLSLFLSEGLTNTPLETLYILLVWNYISWLGKSRRTVKSIIKLWTLSEKLKAYMLSYNWKYCRNILSWPHHFNIYRRLFTCLTEWCILKIRPSS